MQSDRRVALIIGCGAYSLAAPLANPVHDATALEACFKKLGFDEVTLVTNPKLADLVRQLADFSAAADDAEVAVIYFAGHGIAANSQSYLIPCDAELGHARRLDFEAIKLADIMRAIENPRSQLRLIILDACRNNPYRSRMRGGDARRSVEGGLAYVEPHGNMLVAYAAKHGQTALDGDWEGYSPYAKALLAHLETPNLEIRLLFGRVRDDVLHFTKGEQTPHLYGALGGQEIYLMRGGAATPRPQERELPRSRADHLWDEFNISTTTDQELIQAYIAQMELENAALAVYAARKRLEELRPDAKRHSSLDLKGSSSGKTILSDDKPISEDVSPVKREDNKRIECHFLAEAPKELRIGKPSTISVTISQELVDIAINVEAKRESARDIEVATKLIVEALPRRNVRILGETRFEIAPPTQYSPAHIFFNIMPEELGEVHLSIIIRQSQRHLAEFDFEVTAVNNVSSRIVEISQNTRNFIDANPIKPISQLRVVDCESGGKVQFHYELCLPGLVLHRCVSPEIKGNLFEFVNRIYQKIEQYFISSNQDQLPFQINVEAIGGQLLEELLPSDLRNILWSNKSQLHGLQLISTEPFVPWELLFLTDPAQRGTPSTGKFLAEMGLVRWSYKGGYHPQSVRIREGRAKYVAPIYQNAAHQLQEGPAEAKFIEQRLGAISVSPDLTDICELLETGCDLLHFIGHGKSDADDISNSSLDLSHYKDGLWTDAQLSAVIVEQRGNLVHEDGNRALVVLNACQTGRNGWQLTGVGGFAQAFLQAGAGLFVGTLWSVGDHSARVFVEAFYQALIEKKPLAEAAIIARQAARALEASSWLAYTIYGDPNARIVMEARCPEQM